MKKLLLLLAIFTTLILMFSLRGQAGNPDIQTFNNSQYKDFGPLELSPEKGRYALTYAIGVLHSFYFPADLARFVVPDVAYHNGHFKSLFAPGVSFVLLPGFLLGQLVGLAQVGTYAVISLFAVLNVCLIYLISKKIGASMYAAAIGAITFMFATPAFAYGVSLYQHHISVFLMLFGIYLSINSTWKKNILVWMSIGLSILVDYPNIFMMMPLALYALTRIISVRQTATNLIFSLRYSYIITGVFVLLPLIFFVWYNTVAYGNPLQLSGTLASVDAINNRGQPVTLAKLDGKEVNLFEQMQGTAEQSLGTFFNTRNMINGLYIHFISPDRGMLYYAPMALVSVVGMYVVYKKNSEYLLLLTGTMMINIVLYSLWGDPWGGWAFGSRYLIPTYAVASIFISMVLTQYLRKMPVLIVVGLVLYYSFFVNTLGALTSNKIPPQVQVLALEKISKHEEKYTFMRDWDFLSQNGTKSYVYNTFLSDLLTPDQYFIVLYNSIAVFTVGITGFYFLKYEKV